MALLQMVESMKSASDYESKILNESIIPYRDIYRSGGRNDYSKIDKYKGKCGVYVFVFEKNALYVGQSSKQGLYIRLQQHFRERDRGGLRYRLRNDQSKLDDLTNSNLHLFTISDDSKAEILLNEYFLIARLRPQFNII